MFEHSSPLLLFEYFGVPSTLAPADSLPERAQNGLLGACSWVRIWSTIPPFRKGPTSSFAR